MSGPEYPPPPAPGSNAIGSFAIGISPIGTIAPFDWWLTIISQYGNSDRLTTLIGDFFDAADQTGNLDEFFDKVWNVLTAEGWGLDVWGRIVDVGRVLPIVQTIKSFGFAEAGGASVSPFNQASFFPGNTITRNFRLADDAYRRLILAKAFANICDGSIPAINRVLMSMFPGRGNCYVTDGRGQQVAFGFAESSSALGFNQGPFAVAKNIQATVFFGFAEGPSGVGMNQAPFYSIVPGTGMSITYTFEFPLTTLDVAIVTESGVIPKPVGVTATVVQKFPMIEGPP